MTEAEFTQAMAFDNKPLSKSRRFRKSMIVSLISVAVIFGFLGASVLGAAAVTEAVLRDVILWFGGTFFVSWGFMGGSRCIQDVLKTAIVGRVASK